MKEATALLVLLTLNLWTFTSADVEVTCVLTQRCVLPCTFTPGREALIHWRQLVNVAVHSYYKDQDQLSRQDQRFRGRTSLFTEQIAAGNASLQLTGLQVEDEGRYQCYTSIISGGNKESFINLKAEAPVRKVDIEQLENRIVCSSEGIYPEPELTWSIRSPSNGTVQNTTGVQSRRTEQQLFNISSSLTISDLHADLVYVCSVRSGRSSRTTTLWSRPASLQVSVPEATIPCSALNTESPTGFVWRFNHSQIIWTRTRASDEWGPRVEGVSESGSLTLQELSSDQTGVYTCELSDAEETFITSTFLTVEIEKHRGHAGLIVVVAVLIAAVVVVVIDYKRRT